MDASGALRVELAIVRAHYRRTYLIFDILGAFPFDALLLGLHLKDGTAAAAAYSGLGLLRMFRLAKVMLDRPTPAASAPRCRVEWAVVRGRWDRTQTRPLLGDGTARRNAHFS